MRSGHGVVRERQFGLEVAQEFVATLVREVPIIGEEDRAEPSVYPFQGG